MKKGLPRSPPRPMAGRRARQSLCARGRRRSRRPCGPVGVSPLPEVDVANTDVSRSSSGCVNATGHKSKCGFYGLDLYSLHASIAAVISALERAEPKAAAKAPGR